MNTQIESESLENYLEIIEVRANGIFLFKNGDAGFILKLSGLDISFFNEYELQNLNQSLRAALELEDGEEIQFLCRKRLNSFQEYQSWENILQETPPGPARNLREHLFMSWMQSLEKYENLNFTPEFLLTFRIPNSEKIDQKNFIQKLLDRRIRVLDRLQHIPFSIYTLDAQQSLKELFQSSCPSKSTQGPGFDEYWPEIEIQSNQIKIGDEIYKALILKKPPEDFTELGMLIPLLNLSIPIDISCRFKRRPHQSLTNRLRRKKNYLFALKERQRKTTPELDLQIQEVDGVLQRLSERSESLLEMCMLIGIRAPTEDLARRYLGLIESTFYVWGHPIFVNAGISHFDCFIEQIPLGKGKNLEQHSILTSNAVHFLPIFRQASGDEDGAIRFTTRYGNDFKIHAFGHSLANFNWLVSGTSGSGKSFFVNSVIAQSTSLKTRIFIVDIGGSYRKITEFLGGKIVRLETNQKFRISPFLSNSSVDVFEEKRRRERLELVFHEMCRENDQLPSVEEKALLSEALNQLYQNNELPLHPISYVQNFISKKDGKAASRLSYILKKWSYPSFYGEFLDWKYEDSWDSNPIYFDLKGLETFPDLSRLVQFIICHLINLKIHEESVTPKLIVLDEVAFSLLRWQPQFVDELVSTLRKHQAGAILVVQDLEKITANPAGASILQNTQFKAILQQRGHPKNLREPLGLNDLDIQAISSLERKTGVFSEIFLMSDQRRAVLRYRPNFLEYYLATSNPEDNRYLDQQLSKFDGSFSNRILEWAKQEMKL